MNEHGVLEVAVVHRPKYDDWSLPKGKLDPGEGWEEAALREVEEETGLQAELGPQLGEARYIDPKGRPKLVRYWEMTPVGGEFRANKGVDELRWLPVDEAQTLLSNARDRELVARLAVHERPAAGEARAEVGVASAGAMPGGSSSGSTELGGTDRRGRAFFPLTPPRRGVLISTKGDLMRKYTVLGTIVGLAVLAVPSGALANQSGHWTGRDCTYAKSTANGGDQDASVQVPGNEIYVYEGHGSTGEADAAVGACAQTADTQGFQGGDAEAGVTLTKGVIGAQGGPVVCDKDNLINGVCPGVYAVVDGNDNNTAPPAGSPGASQGYIGVSNYEDGTRDPDCNGNDGNGSLGSTNSGGCVGVKGTPVNLPIPLVVCGNTSGPDWNGGNASGDRDGCFIP